MKRLIKCIGHTFEVILIMASVIICIGYMLSGHDNLDFGIERITEITGYALDNNRTELILHKSNPSDSMVIVKDNRGIETIINQMDTLVETDKRWKCVHIAESEAYEIIQANFSTSYQTDQHFRVVCEIGSGYYDYMFYETSPSGINGCLIDADTGTIALYIFNAG